MLADLMHGFRGDMPGLAYTRSANVGGAGLGVPLAIPFVR